MKRVLISKSIKQFQTISFILMIIFIVSCTEKSISTDSVKLNNKDKGSSITSYSFDPSNTNNQYDSTGIYHNLGLENIISHRDILSCVDTIFMGQVCSYTSGWIITFASYGHDSTWWYNWSKSFYDNVDNLTTTQIINNYGTSSTVKNSALSLQGIILSFSDSSHPEILIAQIKSWETDVINSNMTSFEKQQLLRYSSVARYSFAYWYEEFGKGSGTPWNLPCGSMIQSFKSQNIQGFWDVFVKVVKCVVGDAAGALAGTVVAPEAPIAGGVVGAVVVTAAVVATL